MTNDIPPCWHFRLVVVETGRPSVVFVIIALNFVQRVSISVRTPHALKIRGGVIIVSRDYLLLSHLAIGRDLSLLHHPPQRVVFLSQLIDLQREFISNGLDKTFWI